MQFLEYATAIIGITTFIGGSIAWYKGAIEKQYAAQRDFNHLRRNQEQLIQNLDTLFKESDRRFDTIERQLVEIKGIFYSFLRRRDDE